MGGSCQDGDSGGAFSAGTDRCAAHPSRIERPFERKGIRSCTSLSSFSCVGKRRFRGECAASSGRRLVARSVLQSCFVLLVFSVLSQQFFPLFVFASQSGSGEPASAFSAAPPDHSVSVSASPKEAGRISSQAEPALAAQSPPAPIASRIVGRKENLERLVEFDVFRNDDAEDVRLLLLRTDEYPVKYTSSTMQYFLRMPLFQQLSVVAREKQPANLGQKRKLIGVAGTALDDQNMANVMMLAIDSSYRRMGLGRELLRQSLEKASLFARGSHQNPNPRYQIQRARLHVWATQAPPLSLYLSTGFTPVEYLPNYYTSQDIKAGYDLQLSLPYKSVEERLRTAVAQQEKRIRMLEARVDRLSPGAPRSGEAKTAEALPPVVVVPIRDASKEEEEKVTAFLAAVDETLRQSAQQAFGNAQLRDFAAFAYAPSTGNVVGVLWITNSPKNGVLSGPKTAVSEYADSDTVLYLLEFLMLEAGKPEHGTIQKIVDRVPAEDVLSLIHHWEAGFRFTNFVEVTNKDGTRLKGFSSFSDMFDWHRDDRSFEHEVAVAIPWRKPEEFALTQRVKLNKNRLALLNATVKELEKNPPQAPSAMGAPASTPGVEAESVPLPEWEAKNLEGTEPHNSVLATQVAGDAHKSAAAPDASGEMALGHSADSAASVSAQEGEKTVEPNAGRKGEADGAREAHDAGRQGPSPSESQASGKLLKGEDADGISPLLQNCTSLLLIVTCFLLFLLCCRRFCQRANPTDTRPAVETAAAEATGSGRRVEAASPGGFKRPKAKKDGYVPVVLPVGAPDPHDEED
uniref:Acetyltransferase domain-containing protein,putative n=2 Tax=Neospora caninum (strain Liverpool) TaxID=572307 RepID=A0A0F7UN55_NEOCL|nr:TPA: acetyltransferase domain-containing protein,putative [Neospora caninum Liverpool]